MRRRAGEAVRAAAGHQPRERAARTPRPVPPVDARSAPPAASALAVAVRFDEPSPACRNVPLRAPSRGPAAISIGSMRRSRRLSNAKDSRRPCRSGTPAGSTGRRDRPVRSQPPDTAGIVPPARMRHRHRLPLAALPLPSVRRRRRNRRFRRSPTRSRRCSPPSNTRPRRVGAPAVADRAVVRAGVSDPTSRSRMSRAACSSAVRPRRARNGRGHRLEGRRAARPRRDRAHQERSIK